MLITATWPDPDQACLYLYAAPARSRSARRDWTHRHRLHRHRLHRHRLHRHRLHRGGDRTANRALHLAIIVRLRYHPGARARAYTARRTTEGLSMPEIIRCQKRYLAREVFTALRAGPPPAVTAAPKTK